MYTRCKRKVQELPFIKYCDSRWGFHTVPSPNKCCMLRRGVRQTKPKYRVAKHSAGCLPRQMIERWKVIICPLQVIPSSITRVASHWGGCYGYPRVTSTFTETKRDVGDSKRLPGCKLTLMVMYVLFCIVCFHRAIWHSSATLTEVYPCFFLRCKANARV